MYTEKHRPQFHFSPKQGWMNDPNGMVYCDGEYHLFYQHHPHSKVWGPMHWGHAVSRDLIHWEELPIALYPDELGTIFSGSAVVDHNNTSGLRTGEEAVLVAIFTHHGEDNEKQSIAYSNDRGRTWIKYKDNPVISNPGLKDFRDPKVFWHEETDRWVMSLACGDHIQFFASPNLIDWEYLSSFGKEYGSHDGVWECPDLIPLNVEGTDEMKWVLIVNINPGGPNGGSAAQYFIGQFDGTSFICDDVPQTTKWADFGRDFYAAVGWSNVEEPVWIGWMSNWQYANETPTDPFRSAMSIPRRLSLRTVDGELMLVQYPIELDALYEEEVFASDLLVVTSTLRRLELPKPQLMIQGEIAENQADNLQVSLKNGPYSLDLTYNQDDHMFMIDRRNSGDISFSDSFASVDKMRIAAIQDFQIFIDQASIEIFINQGSAVMTEQFFPIDHHFTLEISSHGGNVEFSHLSIKQLRSIW